MADSIVELDSVQLDLNIDRIIKHDNCYLAAAYNLDKQTDTKTGALYKL